MTATAQDIIRRLQQEILPLQGYKPQGSGVSIGCPPLEQAFPQKVFPTGAIHDFTATAVEDRAATFGFISALLHSCMHQGSPCVWVGNTDIFPPALTAFDVSPEQVIFIRVRQTKHALWAIEEALKCDRLAAVVGEVAMLGMNESRRLQLAVEQSRVTGLIVRQHPKVQHALACVARWQITSLPSEAEDGLPGLGFPQWNVSLLKVRNGKPGTWQIGWSAEGFSIVSAPVISFPPHQIRHAG